MSAPPYKAPDAAGLRKFGLVTGALFIGLFALIPWLRHKPLPHWPLYPGTPFILLGLVAPRTLGPVHRLWMRLGGMLGWVNMRVILMVVFVVMLTPLGWILRLLSRDPLARKIERGGQGSYRKSATPPSREQMTRPF
jgi:hypothetical protein